MHSSAGFSWQGMAEIDRLRISIAKISRTENMGEIADNIYWDENDTESNFP
jgi:hypothetical protein